MPTSAQVPDDHPMMIAWKAYTETPEYANTKEWAIQPRHTDGSLWGAFNQGYLAGLATKSQPQADAAHEALRLLVEAKDLIDRIESECISSKSFSSPRSIESHPEITRYRYIKSRGWAMARAVLAAQAGK